MWAVRGPPLGSCGHPPSRQAWGRRGLAVVLGEMNTCHACLCQGEVGAP